MIPIDPPPGPAASAVEPTSPLAGGSPPASPAPVTSAANATANPAAASLAGIEGVIERVAREVLRQQRSERRWRLIIRMGWLVLAVLVAWSFMASRNARTPSNAPHTALVELRGEIALDSESSAEAMIGALKLAFEDPGAMAVVLRINSPGGSPVQAGIINDELRRLKAKHKKPVYAVVEEMCASGAYYVAVAADEIYVDKASIVGSIGVLMDGFGFAGLMEKLGVERRLVTAGDNKAMLDPFSPINPRHRELAQATINQVHQQFIAVVKAGRGNKLKESPEMFSGLFWNGEEAVRLGLADKVGNLDYVAREVVKAEEVIDYTPRENVAERLAKRFGASVGAGAVRALREMSPLR